MLKMCRTALRNKPFRIPKRAVSHRETARFRKQDSATRFLRAWERQPLSISSLFAVLK